jgi:hypothetical protein
MSSSMVGKHETMFLTVDFLAQEILGIVESQIERRWIFSLARILLNIRRCLQTRILEKMIFVNKN